MDLNRLDKYWESEHVYLGGNTIFLVRHRRVVGMILLYKEPPIGKDTVDQLKIGRVKT